MRLQPHQLKAISAQQSQGVPADKIVVPAPKPTKKRSNEEWQIQCAFFTWWWSAAKGLGIWPSLCFHIPNSSFLVGTREERARRGRWANMAGVTSGVPDVLLMVPKAWTPSKTLCTAARQHSALLIEFKSPSERSKKNGGLSEAQQEFMSYALARDYACEVCYSWEEGRDAVMKYLNK